MAFTTDFSEEFVKKHYQELYWKQGKSIWDISKELKIPHATVHWDFKKFNIRTRTLKQARKLAWKQGKYKKLIVGKEKDEAKTG